MDELTQAEQFVEMMEYKTKSAMDLAEQEHLASEIKSVLAHARSQILAKHGVMLRWWFWLEDQEVKTSGGEPIRNTGMVCANCDGTEFRPAGSCLVCTNCGESLGGCG